MAEFKIPLLLFNDNFKDGYEDVFVRLLLKLQMETSPDDFSKYPSEIQDDIKNDLSEISNQYTMIMANNMIRERVFDRVADHLLKNGIKEFLPLKGTYLLKTFFKDHTGLRWMCDVDILVRKEDYFKSKEVLEKTGNVGVRLKDRPIYSKIFSDYPVHINGTLVEIHRGKGAVDLFKIKYSDFFEAAVNNIVPPEYMAVFYLLHDMSDGLATYQPLNFRKVVTMYILMNNVDMEKMMDLTKKYGMKELLDIYMFLLDEVFAGHKRFNPSPMFITRRIEKGDGHALFKFKYGDTFFKFFVFRKTLLRKTLPSLLTRIPEAIWSVFKGK